MESAGQPRIAEHLRRILQSPGFAAAPRLQRFLTFIVEAAQSGDTEALKESVLGREVFDRGAGFDPRMDPIVRVEARRLRSRLEEYYAGPGAADPLRIEIPKGGYVPVISAPAPLPMPPRAALTALAGLAAIIAGLAVWWAFRGQDPSPTLAVVPAHWVWDRGEELIPARELQFAEDLTAELVRDSSLPVLAWPLVSQRRGLPLPEFAENVLLVAVRPGAPGERLTCYLLQASTGRKKWVWDEAFTPGQERRIAAAIRERTGLVMRK